MPHAVVLRLGVQSVPGPRPDQPSAGLPLGRLRRLVVAPPVRQQRAPVQLAAPGILTCPGGLQKSIA